jgi:hypothetical protein
VVENGCTFTKKNRLFRAPPSELAAFTASKAKQCRPNSRRLVEAT